MGKTWQDARNAEIDKFEDRPVKPSGPIQKEKKKVVVPYSPVYHKRPSERDMPNWGMRAIHDF